MFFLVQIIKEMPSISNNTSACTVHCSSHLMHPSSHYSQVKDPETTMKSAAGESLDDPLQKDISLKELSEITCRPSSSSRFVFPHPHFYCVSCLLHPPVALSFGFEFEISLGLSRKQNNYNFSSTLHYFIMFISEINSINNGEKTNRKEKTNLHWKVQLLPKIRNNSVDLGLAIIFSKYP